MKYDVEENVVDKIKRLEVLHKAQSEKVENEKYIERLIYQDLVRTVRSNLSVYDFMDISKARSEIGNKLKRDRSNIILFTDHLCEDFLSSNKSFKIKEIIQCGYDLYAWEVRITYNNTKFGITIPVLNNLTISNFDYGYKGQFAFHVQESESYWKLIKTSYRIEDISQAVKEYFNLGEEKEET